MEYVISRNHQFGLVGIKEVLVFATIYHRKQRNYRTRINWTVRHYARPIPERFARCVDHFSNLPIFYFTWESVGYVILHLLKCSCVRNGLSLFVLEPSPVTFFASIAPWPDLSRKGVVSSKHTPSISKVVFSPLHSNHDFPIENVEKLIGSAT